MSIISNDEEYEKSVDLKGYGFRNYEESFFKEKLEHNSNYKLPDNKKYENQIIKICNYDDLKVHPIVIESLEEYISEISKLESSLLNPIFYRGHTNANYYLIPNVFRNHTQKEKQLCNEFLRRFYSETQHCTNSMEKLVFMQHYKMETRALDITESPLLGLFFACADDKRFRKNEIGNKYKWGEVILFRASDSEENRINNYEEVIKNSDSSTVSVMANTAFMDYKFNLQKLEIAYKNDGHGSALSESINFRDVLSHSVIVRTKMDNKRIQNQQGAFIMVNANTIDSDDFDSVKFLEFVMNEKELDVNLNTLKRGLFDKYRTTFKNYESYDIELEKVRPYSSEYKNTNPRMYYDPFNIHCLLYKNNANEQVVFLIPPTAKQTILEQLAKLNITDAFVYPEMDSVCNEICNLI